MLTKLSLIRNKITTPIILVAVLALAFAPTVYFNQSAPEPRQFPVPSQILPKPILNTDHSPATTMSVPKDIPPQAKIMPVAASKAQPNKSQLVRFDNDMARSTFIATNQISESQLIALPNLNLYQIQSNEIISTPGSTIYNDQPYQALLTPTDPQYASQWYLPRINAPQAWNHQAGSANTTIAIIDTGFALNHIDLASKWAKNSGEMGSTATEGAVPNCTSQGLALDKSCNNYDDDNDGFIDNLEGWNFADDNNLPQAGVTSPGSSSATHGSLVAGIIGAAANNSNGISGTSWANSLLPIQALSDSGSGTTVSVGLAIHYAVDHGARVINLSLGSTGDDPILLEQINYALKNNVSVVAAAGNDGCDCLLYPARYPGVIAVGALGSDNNRASFSSYGSALSLVAPGTNSICSTAWTQASPSNSYSCSYSGTSFSSPMVAGAVGLLISQNSALNPSQIQSALISSATKLSGMGGQNRTNLYGYGLLNIYGALAQVSLATPQANPINTHSISVSANSGALIGSMNTICLSNNEVDKCRIRAINQATNQVVNLSDNLSSANPLNLYWNSNTAGLSAGTWIIQTYASSSTASSLAVEETIIIGQ